MIILNAEPQGVCRTVLESPIFRTVVKVVGADPLVMSLNDAEDLARDFMAQEEADLGAELDSY